MQRATRCRQKRCQGGAGQWHADLLALLDKARGTGRQKAGGVGGGGGCAGSGGGKLEAGDGAGDRRDGERGEAADQHLDEASGSAVTGRAEEDNRVEDPG